MTQRVLEYNGYAGTVEFSIDDGTLYGKIQFINDLVTYESETILGLKAEFEAAVDDYLSTCAEEGVSPDKPFNGVFNVRVKPEVHKGVAQAAMRCGVSMNEKVGEVLRKYLEGSDDNFSYIHKHFHEYIVPDKSESYRKSFTLPMNLRNSGNDIKVVM
ncbi:type II toxin-antitoxin system HicB family antitoxin [Salinicola sp. CPA57]|uniref:type II toxin-antitoxin system HicB family antitoxin n=1 Tax=Salinicola sp. CPA57 TaxID=1949080 RepID=UPI000DA18ED8|nr:type II toxin-antitoxin system HicB family antitoxin [Salinicola sp. CPA57]